MIAEENGSSAGAGLQDVCMEFDLAHPFVQMGLGKIGHRGKRPR